MPAPSDLDQLLLAAGRGDQIAFADLYDATVGMVFGLSRRMTRNPAIAEEVTQEVMLEIWRTAPRFDPGRGSARAYIATLAHRRAVDRVRSEEARRARNERAGAGQADREFDSVAEAVERDLDRSRVARAIARLTEVQREAIVLAYFDGMTQSEIAARLSVPLGTVKTRMRDGMLRLSTALEEHP